MNSKVGLGEPQAPDKPILQSMAAFADRLGISLRHAHNLARLHENPLPTVRLGRRRLVPVSAGIAWAQSLLDRSAA